MRDLKSTTFRKFLPMALIAASIPLAHAETIGAKKEFIIGIGYNQVTNSSSFDKESGKETDSQTKSYCTDELRFGDLSPSQAPGFKQITPGTKLEVYYLDQINDGKHASNTLFIGYDPASLVRRLNKDTKELARFAAFEELKGDGYDVFGSLMESKGREAAEKLLNVRNFRVQFSSHEKAEALKKLLESDQFVQLRAVPSVGTLFDDNCHANYVQLDQGEIYYSSDLQLKLSPDAKSFVSFDDWYAAMHPSVADAAKVAVKDLVVGGLLDPIFSAPIVAAHDVQAYEGKLKAIRAEVSSTESAAGGAQAKSGK